MSIQYGLSPETVVKVANTLKVDHDALLSTLDLLERSPLSLYANVKIRKGNGRYRDISVPTSFLKSLQKTVLQACSKGFNHGKYCHGFAMNRSVVTNAKCHVGCTLAVTLDFENFFTSIKGDKVFEQFLGLCHGADMAYVCTLICTVANSDVNPRELSNRFLPQGTSTSPFLSNLCTNKFDYRIAGLLKKKLSSWTYTRYADDLTFSTSDSNQDVGRLLSAVKRITNDEGFSIADTKTHVERDPLSISVTGIIVNPKLHLSRSYSRRIRAAIYKLNTVAPLKVMERTDYALRLSGMLSFMASVNFQQFNDLYVRYKLHEQDWMSDTPISKYFWSTRKDKKALPRSVSASIRRAIYRLETTTGCLSSYRLSVLRGELTQMRELDSVGFTELVAKHAWLVSLIQSSEVPTSKVLGLPMRSPKNGNRLLRQTVFKTRFRRHRDVEDIDEEDIDEEDGDYILSENFRPHYSPSLVYYKKEEQTVTEIETKTDHEIAIEQATRISMENWFDGKIHNL